MSYYLFLYKFGLLILLEGFLHVFFMVRVGLSNSLNIDTYYGYALVSVIFVVSSTITVRHFPVCRKKS